jgi:hypothetical protein
MAGLFRTKRDAEGSRQRVAKHLSRIAMDTTRDVDRNDRDIGCGDCFQRFSNGALDRADQASTENGIDDEGAVRDRFGLKSLNRPSPIGRRQGGIAFQQGLVAKESNPHRPTGVLKMACRHEAVATVIAGAAQDKGGPRGVAKSNVIGDRATGRFHQLDAGHTGVDGAGIGGIHLLDAEEAVIASAAAGH